MDITSDLVFEIELVKQIDISIDYIFEQIKNFHQENIENREIVSMITKMVDSSYELRSKKDLIIQFLNSLYNEIKIDMNSINEIVDAYNKFKNIQMKLELNQIVEELNLNLLKTKKYIDDCFKAGELKILGTNINEILPKISRFSKDNDENKRYKIKMKAIEKLQNYFDKFFGA